MDTPDRLKFRGRGIKQITPAIISVKLENDHSYVSAPRMVSRAAFRAGRALATIEITTTNANHRITAGIEKTETIGLAMSGIPVQSGGITAGGAERAIAPATRSI